MKLSLSERMRNYEYYESERKFLPTLPVIARIDGKNFSKFTRDLNKPFDQKLFLCIFDLALKLMEKTNALYCYTQSDEITLIFFSENYDSQIFHGGKILKMTSILSSMSTSIFQKNIENSLPQKAKELPLFDCRVWQVPNKVEAVGSILFREQDGIRNSIANLTRKYVSHKNLQHVNTKDMLKTLLNDHSVDWNESPEYFKHGCHFQKRNVKRKFTTEEIEKLPKKHNARTNPDLEVERNEIKVIDFKNKTLQKTRNRQGVIFKGEDPIFFE